MKQIPSPRSAHFMGMKTEPMLMALGTWLEPEEMCYPSGAMRRKARAFNTETGQLVTVSCGIPDTYFSIPTRDGRFLTVSNGGILLYHGK